MVKGKPLRNTEVLRKLIHIKKQVEDGNEKEDILNNLQYLIDNV